MHSLDVHTIVRPIDDVLGKGEGKYYAQRDEEIPLVKPSADVLGSSNPINLAHCDTLTLLSRFAHLTHDEQRKFERQHSLAMGSVSPQLDCVVRLAIAISNEQEEPGNYVMVLDLSPFGHV